MYNPIKPSKTKVIDLIRTTWNSPYLKITPGIYATFTRLFNYPEIDHTDGIGTKGLYHWKAKTFRNAVLDALAMNLNDLAMVGAIPYKLQNHIVLPQDDTEAIVKIINYLTKECIKRNIAITGGETSIQNTSEGIDISITVSGFIKKIKINQFKTNDILIGLPSSGLHSNGITKVREVFKSEIRKEFTVPTKIYSDIILPLYEKYDLHGLMHMTGGAFSKLKDILPKNNDVLITNSHKLKPQKIFFDIYKKGVSDKDMYKTFNCGVGFIFSVSPKDAPKLIQEAHGEIIGEIISGTGKVKIKSMFSKKEVEI